ncbi:hypothetical protein EON63_03885, partial [archaeon]
MNLHTSLELPPPAHEDPENITIMIAQHLHQPTILLQLPILVKINEIWLRELCKARNKEFFNSSVNASMEEEGNSPEDLIDEWWGLLYKIVDYSVRVHGAPSSPTLPPSSSLSLTKEELYTHIHTIRTTPTLDLLSAELQDQVLPGFARDLKRIMQRVGLEIGVGIGAGSDKRKSGDADNEVGGGGDRESRAHADSLPSELDTHSHTLTHTHVPAHTHAHT